jgi:hypothetical protein
MADVLQWRAPAQAGSRGSYLRVPIVTKYSRGIAMSRSESVTNLNPAFRQFFQAVIQHRNGTPSKFELTLCGLVRPVHQLPGRSAILRYLTAG